MTQLTPLSPIHIGSGEVYENFLLLNGYRYSFDGFLSAVFQNRKKHLLSPTFLKDLISISFSNSGQGKEQIREVLTPTKQQIETIHPLYPTHSYFDDSMLKEKDIFAFVKTANEPYIPGSTLKGYIMNVLFFDMIQHEIPIQDYLKDMLERAALEMANKDYSTIEKTNIMSDFRKVERDVMIAAARYLICRDVSAKQPLGIYFINRKTKVGPIPQVAECLNRAFSRVTLQEQKAFVEKYRQDPELNFPRLMNQLLEIERLLDEGKIVIQIGKYTNYYSKSASMGFGKKFFDMMYVDVFRPVVKKKNPEIQTMNLITSESNIKDLIEIPGYLLIEW